MSPTAATHQPIVTVQNPLREAHAKLIERLALIAPPKAIRIFPSPGDFEAIRDYLRELAEVIDDTVAAIGFEVADNSPYNVDSRSFDAVMTMAIDSPVFECERICERLQDDREAA